MCVGKYERLPCMCTSVCSSIYVCGGKGFLHPVSSSISALYCMEKGSETRREQTQAQVYIAMTSPRVPTKRSPWTKPSAQPQFL